MGFFAAIADYLRMIKFSHTIFALPLAGVAFLKAMTLSGLWRDGGPSAEFFPMLIKTLVAMAALRSAAMGFNRIVDRDIDAANPRTAARELPGGKISVSRAWLFTIVSLAIFFLAAWSINWLCAALSPLAAIAVLGYSFTKRFTFLCHFFLGFAIGLAPSAAWIALLERIELLPLLWSAGLMFYIAGFDILYACQDAEFDRSYGLHSAPARFGIPAALWIARAAHVLALAAFIAAGRVSGYGWIFGAAICAVALMFFLEHWLVRPGKLDRIPIAFFNINAAISSILFLGALLDWLVY